MTGSRQGLPRSNSDTTAFVIDPDDYRIDILRKAAPEVPMLKGHCLCGAVRYEAAAPPTLESICHCTMCRRAAGSPMVGWFTVPRGSYRVLSGTPVRYQSSPHAVRTFCGVCGTPLTFESTRFPDETDITICSLEDPEQVPPRDHTRASTKLSWVRLADGLPAYPEQRTA